jgi:ribosome-associated toxin RatA of RatAB toxin-antitoxin module
MSSLFQLLALVNQYLRRVPKFERGRVLNAPKHILALVAHCSSARVTKPLKMKGGLI